MVEAEETTMVGSTAAWITAGKTRTVVGLLTVVVVEPVERL
jgi:hypothetical protein